MNKYLQSFRNACLLILLFSFATAVDATPATTPPKTLKAILVVGPTEDSTPEAIAAMKKVATFLRSKDVNVTTFYDPHADWDKISRAATQANIFIYAGHGTHYGENGKVGGLCLSGDKYISSKTIEKDLKLAPNAMVLFQSVCYGAGSTATDTKSISTTKAVERVTDYIQPFFTCGAACYYASNFGDGCLDFLKLFFEGQTVRQCFEDEASMFCKIETTEASGIQPGVEISIASHASEGESVITSYVNGVKSVKKMKSIKSYDIAYLANPSYSIKDLMGE